MIMLTAEETSVLHYLVGHPIITVAELAHTCLPRTAAGWLDRVASNLDWLGYVVAYHGPDGQPIALQIIERGRGAVAASLPSRPIVGQKAE